MNPVAPARRIIFEDVSKFYGEVLGVNRVSLAIPPGITSLVGPNGSGKTTLMNLLTGLIRPSRGSIRVFGMTAADPERFFREVAYCTQFDSFPRGITGYQFVYSFLRLYGCRHSEAEEATWRAIERVSLVEAAHRKIAGYSKGMRQRIKLAQSICHGPSVLVLDEPLNGLDPLVRAETIALFKSLAQDGMHVIISSHILHEVDAISDQMILLSSGYVVAEGQIRGVRDEIQDHPMQIMVRCLMLKTRDPNRFYLMLNRIALNGIAIESVAPADDDVNSVYEYLIGSEEATK
jgi:ABC-2 type transport system ATP-binding protein